MSEGIGAQPSHPATQASSPASESRTDMTAARFMVYLKAGSARKSTPVHSQVGRCVSGMRRDAPSNQAA